MSQTTEQLDTLLSAERSRILQNTLASYVEGIKHSTDMSNLTRDVISRPTAEKQMQEVFAVLPGSSIDMADKVQMFSIFQELQRIRRDVKISRMGHKQLIAGCLATAHLHKVKLDKDAKNAETGS